MDILPTTHFTWNHILTKFAMLRTQCGIWTIFLSHLDFTWNRFFNILVTSGPEYWKLDFMNHFTWNHNLTKFAMLRTQCGIWTINLSPRFYVKSFIFNILVTSRPEYRKLDFTKFHQHVINLTKFTYLPLPIRK